MSIKDIPQQELTPLIEAKVKENIANKDSRIELNSCTKNNHLGFMKYKYIKSYKLLFTIIGAFTLRYFSKVYVQLLHKNHHLEFTRCKYTRYFYKVLLYS